MFAGIPNALLLAFEEGHAFVEAKKIVIDVWDVGLSVRKAGGSWGKDDDGNVHASAMEVLEALEHNCPYDFIIVDTADMASKMCTDYKCAAVGVQHPSDGGDYGKGWDLLQTAPFRQWYGRLVKLGVGIGCTSHVDLKIEKDKKGNITSVKRETTLPKGIQKFIHTQSDVIINGTFGRRRKGAYERDRIVCFDGSQDVLAGTRIRGVPIPKKYVVTPPSDTDQALPWKQWCKFFEDGGVEYAARLEAAFGKEAVVGLDDENLPATAQNQSTETVAAKEKSEAEAEKAAAVAESE